VNCTAYRPPPTDCPLLAAVTLVAKFLLTLFYYIVLFAKINIFRDYLPTSPDRCLRLENYERKKLP
jgi:hypothetical protein